MWSRIETMGLIDVFRRCWLIDQIDQINWIDQLIVSKLTWLLLNTYQPVLHFIVLQYFHFR